MRLFRTVGLAVAAMAAVSAAPSYAATYNLGTLPANSRVFTTGALVPVLNPSDTYIFGVGVIGDLGSKLVTVSLGGIPGLTASFYKGIAGSGTFLKTITAGGPGNFISKVTPGPYYATVNSSLGTGAYQLSLITEGQPAPAPGPAGLLVFGAGAAVMAVKKRRAAKRDA